MKPENYRFVSLKQDKQDQWAPLGVSSRLEFSFSTTTEVRGGTIAWETVVIMLKVGGKPSTFSMVALCPPLMVVS